MLCDEGKIVLKTGHDTGDGKAAVALRPQNNFHYSSLWQS